MSGGSTPSAEPNVESLLGSLRDHFTRVAYQEHWGRTLMALAWLHLAFFLACHAIYIWPDHRPWQHVALWFAEVVAILILLRRMNGRLWFRKTPLAGVVLRVWSTFLIIAFNSATLNAMTGFATDWFKLSWTALSTFGFATTAWILGWRFLIPAVQMYFTGLIVAQYPRSAFAIYGVSWWIALLVIGFMSERQARAAAAGESAATDHASPAHPPAHTPLARHTARPLTP